MILIPLIFIFMFLVRWGIVKGFFELMWVCFVLWLLGIKVIIGIAVVCCIVTGVTMVEKSSR